MRGFVDLLLVVVLPSVTFRGILLVCVGGGWPGFGLRRRTPRFLLGRMGVLLQDLQILVFVLVLVFVLGPGGGARHMLGFAYVLAVSK